MEQIKNLDLEAISFDIANLKLEYFTTTLWGWKYNLNYTENTRTDLLSFKPGGYTSKHLHFKKINIIFCLVGKLKIEYLEEGKDVPIMRYIGPKCPTRKMDIMPRIIHRITAIERSMAIEIDVSPQGMLCSVDDIQRLDKGGILK